MDQLLGYISQMISLAQPCTHLITDGQDGLTFQEWGPWDENGRPQQLQTFQAAGALARTAAILALNPQFKASYATQRAEIAAFVKQAIFDYWFDKQTGVYRDPTTSRLGGLIPWVPVELGGWGTYPVWSDKCSHLGMMAAWMYEATGDPLYLEYATRVAKAFREHLQVQNGCLVWDPNAVPILDGENLEGWPDTSHANREPMMVVSLYQAGIEFNMPDLAGLAMTFTTLIWNGSETDPRFANYINGGNLAYRDLGPWANGNVYLGWNMLGRYSPEVLRVLGLADALIQSTQPLNPSLATNATSYGRVELEGTLLWSVAP